MAKDITLMGKDYYEAQGISVPKTEGGRAVYYDVSETDAAPGDVLVGKTFVDSSGQLRTGTLPEGGGGSCQNWVDGQATGSVRTVTAAEEGDDYWLGTGAVAEGNSTKASGMYSHAEGAETEASGDYSHAEGSQTEASGDYSHAEGLRTIASGVAQHVFGKYNQTDDEIAHIEIVGNGANASNRSNARTLDWDGNETLAGKLTVGVGPENAMDVATKQYVDAHSGGGGGMLLLDEMSGYRLSCSYNDILDAIENNRVVMYRHNRDGNYYNLCPLVQYGTQLNGSTTQYYITFMDLLASLDPEIVYYAIDPDEFMEFPLS